MYVSKPALIKGIAEAQEVVAEARNIAIATVLPNGEPHNTVIGNGLEPPGQETIINTDGILYWWSYDTARHSKAIERLPIASIVIFDSHRDRTSVGMSVHAFEVPDDQISAAIEKYHAVRDARGLPRKKPEDFSKTKARPKRMYCGVPRGPEHVRIPIKGRDIDGVHRDNVSFAIGMAVLMQRAPMVYPETVRVVETLTD
jgi:hypothetical protein